MMVLAERLVLSFSSVIVISPKTMKAFENGKDTNVTNHLAATTFYKVLSNIYLKDVNNP